MTSILCHKRKNPFDERLELKRQCNITLVQSEVGEQVELKSGEISSSRQPDDLYLKEIKELKKEISELKMMVAMLMGIPQCDHSSEYIN